MSKTTFTVDKGAKTIVMERVFDAPRSRVWQAWTKPEELAKWWGPRGWETTIKKFEFKPGGAWHYMMKCVDENQKEWFGQESWGIGTFKEINPEDNFRYEDAFTDSSGAPNPEMPITPITNRFEETDDGKTKVTSITQYASDKDLQTVVDMGVEQGAKETWDRLAEYLQ
jgi:uncharacterized protein YndB with AHSA1/START domain